MARRLRPLWTPSHAGGVSAVRSALGVPSLVTGPLPNSTFYWNDFYTGSFAPSRYGEALSATLPGVQTIIYQTGFGSPEWMYSVFAGTNGSVGCDNDADKFGNLRLNTGAGANQALMVEAGGVGTTGSANKAFPWVSSVNPSTAQFRFQATTVGGSPDNFIYGFGFADTPTTITDCLSDPDALFNTNNAVLFYYNVGAYAGLGGSFGAGDFGVRYYSTQADGNQFLVLANGLSWNAYHKIEMAQKDGTMNFYLDGVLAGSLTVTTTLAHSGRPFMMAKVLGGQARILWIDSLFWEVGMATPR